MTDPAEPSEPTVPQAHVSGAKTGKSEPSESSEPGPVSAADPLATTDPSSPPVSVVSGRYEDGAGGSDEGVDLETTVNLTGDDELFRGLATQVLAEDRARTEKADDVTRSHLKGLLEALIFASDRPVKTGDLAKAASAQSRIVKDLLEELKFEYHARGVQLDEVAGGWIFRTNAAYAPFVRDMTKQKPVRLTRAQVETLAIIAYRQPITRPEVDDIRGVDSGPVLKLLLERDLVRILGKKDEPGRPLLYGTTTVFLEFFGLRSLKDLPTLEEFTELNEDSRRVVEKELGEVLDHSQPAPTVAEPASLEESDERNERLPHDTISPPAGEPGETPRPGEQPPREGRDPS